MQGVGAGRLISNRYALTERRARSGEVEVWRATDNTLGREVAVTAFPTSHPHAEAVLDAARRSAAINDHRLIRVLDVGTRGELSWLVEESLAESSSIAELVARGPLPPEEARRIAGEVASGLDVAAQQGLHHLHITPHSVRRTRGGLVKIAGLATAAAFEDGSEPDPATAARADATATVGVMYAAMTGRWPGPTSVPGLPDAPTIVGGVSAPSEIAAAVPPDLDALARVTFNHDDGPATPGELVSRIAPWSSTPVTRVEPRGAVARPAAAGERTEHLPVTRTSQAARPAAPATRVVDRHREHRASRAAATRARLEERRNDPAFLNLPEALERHRHDPLAAPAPLVPAEPAVEGRYAKVVIAVVAVVIVVALAFAVPTIKNAFSMPPKPANAPAPAATTASGTATPATRTSEATASATPIEVERAEGFDPEGDGREKDSQARRVIDGESSTAWTSETYDQPLPEQEKKGVGVILTLPDDSSVSKVDLDLGDTSQSASVYAVPEKRIDEAGLVGKVSDASGTTSVSASAPISAKYVIVWFTDTAARSGGGYRATLAEAAVS